MINLGPHAGFILGSYAVCAAIIAALAAWIIFDNRARQRELARLETSRRPEARQ